MYLQIKSGEAMVFSDKDEMLQNLDRLRKNTSFDKQYFDTINLYNELNEAELILNYEDEFLRVFNDSIFLDRVNEMQALFIEYSDDYYYYTSCIECYGMQQYPIVIEPRYISNEYDYNKYILMIEKGINFEKSSPSVDDIFYTYGEYLNINILQLFQLNTRILLFKALNNLDNNGRLSFIKNSPFMFYINQHDTEVMSLYVKL